VKAYSYNIFRERTQQFKTVLVSVVEKEATHLYKILLCIALSHDAKIII